MRKNYFAKKFVAYSMAFAVAFSTLTVSPVFVKEAKAAAAYVTDIAGNTISDGAVILSKLDSDNNTIGTSISIANLKTKLQLGGSSVISGVTLKDNGTNVTGAGLITATSTYDFYTPNTTTTLHATIANSSYTSASNVPVLLDGKANKTAAVLKLTGVKKPGTWYKLSKRTGSYTEASSSTTATVKYEYFVANKLISCDGHEAATNNYTFNNATELSASDMGMYIYVTDGSCGPALTGTENYDSGKDYYGFKDDTYTKIPNNIVADKASARTISSGSAFGTDLIADLKAIDSYVSIHEFNAVPNRIEKLYNYAEASDLTAKVRKENTLTSLGSTASMSVVASNTNGRTISYKWSKDGKDLNNDSATLKIDSVAKDDLGSYKCVVTDGIAEQALYPRLSNTNTSDVTSNANIHSLETQMNVLNNANQLPSGKVVLTSSIPNDNYKFIWTKSTTTPSASNVGITLSQSNTLNYNPSSESIVYEDTANFATTGTTVTCYAIPASIYDTVLKDELERVAEATDDVTKYKENETLRSAELTQYDSDGNTSPDRYLYQDAVYTETFSFAQTNVTSSSAIRKVKLGDSVTLDAPKFTTTVPSAAYKYQWKVNNKLASVSDEKNFTIDTVDVKDLGQIECEVLECNKSTHIPAGGSTKCEDDAANCEYNNILATIVYNIVCESDLTAKADNITAKDGQKDVSLKVEASSSLPITYSWAKVTDGAKGAPISTKDTYTLNTVSNANKDFYTAKSDTATTGKNLYICIVSDGIKTIEVPVKITEIATFKVFETKLDVEEGNVLPNNKDLYYSSLKGEKIELSPVVVAASEEIEKQLTYTWKKDGIVCSSDKSLSVEVTDAASTYSVTITEGTNEITVKYNVSKISTDLLKDVTLADIGFDWKHTNTYTGKEINPIYYVKAGLSTNKGNDTPNITYETHYMLKEGVDYTVELTDAVNAGVSVFKINFIGDFADVYKNVPVANHIEQDFIITRADNKVEIADNTVVVGKSALPKTVTNLGKGALTYTYYADADATTEIAAPTKVGTYYVKATANATINYNEAESNVATVKVVPGKVKMLGTSRTASSVKLNWNKATGATSYRVYYKAAGAKSYKVFKNTTATSMNVTGLASATTYTFAVKAYAKTAGYSTVYATKQSTTAPAKVATPSVTAGSKKATVKFTKVARATGYQIYMAKGNGKYVKVKTTTSTSFTKTGLAKGATYKFKVRAYKTVGSNTYYGAFSSAKAVKVK